MQVKRRNKFIITSTILIFMLVLISLMSICTGYTRLSPADICRILFGMGTPQENLILFDFRMPRMVISILIGAGLSVSGCVFQSVTRNGLASPGLLGVNAGAGIAVLLYTFLLPSSKYLGIYEQPVAAFLGSTVISLGIFLISGKNSKSPSTFRLILVGIAVSTGINALSMIVTVRLSPEQFRVVNIWLIGNVARSNWSYVLSLLPWIILIIPIFMINSKTLNVLGLSDEVSIGLGANLKAERFVFLMLAVGLAASCVAIGGGIGFVGLICPHLARKLVSPAHQYSIPLSALTGAVLLAGADFIARNIIQPNEIPLGIIVAVVGAPYFLYLLMVEKKGG